MNNKVLACRDCPNRFPGCHGSCQSYIEWKTEHEKEKKETIKKRWLENLGAKK